jgi:hypothetical protein
MPSLPAPAMLSFSIPRPAVSLLPPVALSRVAFPLAGVLAAAVLAAPMGLRAQTLMDVTGATVIQGTLNNTSTSVPGSGSIQRAREASAAAEASLNQRSANMPGAGSGAPGAITPASGGSTRSAGPAVPGTTTARVNGKAVPVCSHGALCHGALLRAMGGG